MVLKLTSILEHGTGITSTAIVVIETFARTMLDNPLEVR